MVTDPYNTASQTDRRKLRSLCAGQLSARRSAERDAGRPLRAAADIALVKLTRKRSSLSIWFPHRHEQRPMEFFTWRAGSSIMTPDMMLYASAAKGYKSGGFNTRPVANLPNLGINQFKPETAATYEVGIRSEWFRRRLRLNATVFHTGYRDLQLRQQSIIDGVLTTIIDNAARARIRGLEIEAPPGSATASDQPTAISIRAMSTSALCRTSL